MFSLISSESRENGISTFECVKRSMAKWQTYLILLGMVIILIFLTPSFLQVRNLLNVIRQISITAIIGFGVTFCIITAGIDLSSGSVVALAGVVAASFGHGHYPLIVAVAFGLIASAFIGLINGGVAAYGRIPPFITTLGMTTAARGLALIYSNGRPVTGISPSFEYIGGGYLWGIPVPIYIMIVVAIISHTILKHTKFGKHVYAIGGNQQAALISGINIKRTTTLIYVYASTLAGISGIILAGRLSAGQPTAGVGYELDAIAASAIGGTSFLGGIGTIPGVLAGALIIGVLNNGLVLLNVSPYLQQIVKGVVIIVAVLLDRGKNK